jgi:phosphate transport system substrate-binding protein
MKQISRILVLSLSLGLSVSASNAVEAALIKIDGSSTVFPITEAVAEEFQAAQKVQVTVGISGTGGGFKKFCRGETDIQNASRPISKEEMANCKTAGVSYFELPVAFDAISVVVSPKNTWAKDISIEELKKIWEPSAQGKITKWNQIRPQWPNTEIKLFGAGSDSGTFDYFTEAVVGKAKSSRGDYTASEDDNTLVQGIANDQNALGYIPHSYYEMNKTRLTALPVISNDPKAPMKAKAVLPTDENVEKGTYFPLSRPIFIYVSAAAAKKAEVKNFTEFYLKNAPTLVKQVKYVTLPSAAYELSLKNFSNNKVGTAFGGGSQVGVRVEELLTRESQL